MAHKSLSRGGKLLEVLIVGLTMLMSVYRIFSYASLRGFNCVTLENQGSVICSLTFPWFEVICLLAASAGAVYVIQNRKMWKAYLSAWKKSWLILIFLGLILVSTLWSIFPAATFYRAINLILITFLAVFIGVRWPLRKVVEFFAWTIGSLAVLCLLAVLIFPHFGIMSSPPYTGSWAGIFWHRNYLGTIMALGCMIFLIRLLDADLSHRTRIVNGAFYLVTLVLVAGSKSATGIILAVIFSVTCIFFFAWLALRYKLKAQHYLGFTLVCGLLVVFAVWKMDVLLGILGRNSSLTGRMPLWDYLWMNFISKKLWLGYGYGVFWGYELIRIQIQSALGWMYPVLIGDNGWVDMAIHLGLVGVILFTLILVLFGFYSVKLVIRQEDMLSFFPLSLLLFIVISNITLSLFLELESITWVMLISTMFALFTFQDISVNSHL